MNDAQILAFSLTILTVYIAPELSAKTRQLAASVYFVASAAVAVKMLLEIVS